MGKIVLQQTQMLAWPLVKASDGVSLNIRWGLILFVLQKRHKQFEIVTDI